jgi:hypothetical protein
VVLISYEQHKAAYDARREQSIEGMVCFCACGCNLPVKALRFGGPVTCADCQSEAIKPGGRKTHFLTPPPAETYDWDMAEALQTMADRGIPVQTIDTATVKAIVADRIAAEKRAPKVLRHIPVVQRAVAKDVDLDRVHIPQSLSDGLYDVEMDNGDTVPLRLTRPADGPMVGFTVVEHYIEGEWKPFGVQYPDPKPDPLGLTRDYKQTYRGQMPYLVWLLVEAQ